MSDLSVGSKVWARRSDAGLWWPATVTDVSGDTVSVKRAGFVNNAKIHRNNVKLADASVNASDGPMDSKDLDLASTNLVWARRRKDKTYRPAHLVKEDVGGMISVKFLDSPRAVDVCDVFQRSALSSPLFVKSESKASPSVAVSRLTDLQIKSHLAVTTSRRGRKVTKKTYVEEEREEDVEDEGAEDKDWREEQEDEEDVKPLARKRKICGRRSAPAAMESAPEELSDFEKLRLQNIAEREAMFRSLLGDMNALKASLAPPTVTTPVRRRRSLGVPGMTMAKRFPTRSFNLRSRKRSGAASSCSSDSGFNDDEDDDAENSSSDESELDIDELERRCSRRRADHEPRAHPSRWLFDPNASMLSVDDVTPAMLEAVASVYNLKVYDKGSRGSSCHQCRQKTIDVKTVCRSGRCVGIRGQFCGVCLQNRYGEDARSALKDPAWSCPPCRSICNCSLCRSRLGKCPTGQLIYTAEANGFKSAREYLEHIGDGRKKSKRARMEDLKEEENEEEDIKKFIDDSQA